MPIESIINQPPNTFRKTEDLYFENPYLWSTADAMTCWRYIGRILENAAAGKSDSIELIQTLNFHRMSQPVLALFKLCITSLPMSTAYISNEDIEFITQTKPLSKPFILSETPHHKFYNYEAMGVII